ncbi:Bcr/CflA family efflux MFS transporter [Cellulomonas fengjieae]|uniref:Bcr/CflA family efflux MFS transporter n=1 Tax=Cellulomonas fengjieae TaxID=2819978 RepID=A0ABS3SLR8_9CELL|nr:Bcr/CflA family efflux MFS transporter [Cellulomonas fengjieae]MBO3085940.1 Bcr/CflA family efflux MFS transporter [Cellulomonas fengjieae]QVI65988.1 Bcr/CflA family efflux MFS transporter [Cellulomonas fengjieae]
MKLRTRPGALATRQVLVLGLLTALGPVSIDLYVPALPTLQHDLDASGGAAQLTLAGMTLGLALGELCIGAWSDRVGRRRPLLLSCTVHLGATVGCALAPTVTALAGYRFVQGVGAAGGSVLVLAIVRDIAAGDRLARLVAQVTVVTTTAPLLAPVVGAELLPLTGWRGVFGVLAVASALLLLVTWRTIGETHRPDSGATDVVRRVRAVLADRSFRQAAVVGSAVSAGVYAYVAASPLLLQDVHGLSPRSYGLVFLANSAGLVAGVRLSGWLTPRRGTPVVLAGFAGATLLTASALRPLEASFGLAGLLAGLWLFVASCGGCFPSAAALAVGRQADQSGTASSLYGFAVFTASGLVSPIAGTIGFTDATTVACVLVGTSSVAVVGGLRVLRSTREPSVRPPSG